MKISINKSEFRDEFARRGRKDQFSYEALGLLFDYFEDCEPDYELDVIAICCEFVEMSDAEAREQYDIQQQTVDGMLVENTNYIGATDVGHVFAQF
jgi:hypothetical protein